jgi:ABC-type transport system involved in multi-copper enzyme maturation permease subunit
MFATLIQKELRAIIVSPKFAATFAVVTVLMLLSTYIGVREYQTSVVQHDTAVSLAAQRIQESDSWQRVSDKAYRAPDPMQVFVSGLNYDIGRWSAIGQSSTVKLTNSPYSDDPIYAVFRFVDFAFIVQVVLSLLAILFTYDAVCGERESGTLRLVFSNTVPRAQYLLAKCSGIWLGLTVPLGVSVGLSLLLVIFFRVPLTGENWLKLTVLLAVSLLFFTLFVVAGVLVSTLVRRSNLAFLLALVTWVAFVFIIPRVGVMAASQMVYVPRAAEIEGQRDAYAKDKWKEFQAQADRTWHVADSGKAGCAVADETMWAQLEKEQAARAVVEKEIDAYEARLMEDLAARKSTQQQLAFRLTRFSPVAAYQLAAMALTGSGLELKTRYEDAMKQYRTTFNDYVAAKSKGLGPAGAMAIAIGSDGSVQVKTSRENAVLDVSDRPVFVPPPAALGDALGALITDIGVLVLGIIIAFAGAFASFLRYDVR